MSAPTYEIDERDGNPMLRIKIRGREYGFSLYDVPVKRRGWMAEVVARQFAEVDRIAEVETDRARTKQIREALNL